MIRITNYLEKKLQEIGIYNLKELDEIGFIQAFSLIKNKFPSVTFNLLYELFCLLNNISFSDLTKEMKQKLIIEYKKQPPQYAMPDSMLIEKYLNCALELAMIAYEEQEIPIGAVIVYNNQIIGQGYNQTRQYNDILAHAEIQAIRKAQEYLGNFRLNQCDLFVTVEPCVMCSGAIINSRIKRVVFGANEPKTGACISQYKIFENKAVNSHCQQIGPINQHKYGQLMQDFFRGKKSTNPLNT